MSVQEGRDFALHHNREGGRSVGEFHDFRDDRCEKEMMSDRSRVVCIEELTLRVEALVRDLLGEPAAACAEVRSVPTLRAAPRDAPSLFVHM